MSLSVGIVPASSKSNYLDMVTFNTAFGGDYVVNGEEKVQRALVDYATRYPSHWHLFAIQEFFNVSGVRRLKDALDTSR